jgi:chitinase
MGWLKEEGFGGIMIWSVDMDDFRGSCGTGKYPLLNAMTKELEDYRVALEYEGPYESSNPGAKGYTTKDREYLAVKLFQPQICHYHIEATIPFSRI